MPILLLSAELEANPEQLGGKAAGIVRMLQLNIPVPPAFVITTDECARFRNSGGIVPMDLIKALPQAINYLEQQTGMNFGRGPQPLLVSVRSGAPISMPGMMDTILNVGITNSIESALAVWSGNPEFADDIHTRFLTQFKEIVGSDAPAHPMAQLEAAIAAVFTSWNSDRAIAYRKDRNLSVKGGTAVTVQAMVYGNLDDQSGTGVLFSRNPITGTEECYGEWLPHSQGEDVVSGRIDPQQLTGLQQQLPEVYSDLIKISEKLERARQEVQDIEFTVQSGKLWLLQTRAAKCSAIAAVRLAVLLARAGIISKAQALERVSPTQISMMLRPHINPGLRTSATVLASGYPASPGVVSGIIVSDTEEAEERALAGEDIILARQTTNPEDVRAMVVVKGIVTEIGGATSHAAVVSRELNVACVVGCGTDTITQMVGQPITLDGNNGEILAGYLPLVKSDEKQDADLLSLHHWEREAAVSDVPLK